MSACAIIKVAGASFIEPSFVKRNVALLQGAQSRHDSTIEPCTLPLLMQRSLSTKYDIAIPFRWWQEYSHRKNDEEDMVADCLMYDDRFHLPRTIPGPVFDKSD